MVFLFILTCKLRRLMVSVLIYELRSLIVFFFNWIWEFKSYWFLLLICNWRVFLWIVLWGVWWLYYLTWFENGRVLCCGLILRKWDLWLWCDMCVWLAGKALEWGWKGFRPGGLEMLFLPWWIPGVEGGVDVFLSRYVGDALLCYVCRGWCWLHPHYVRVEVYTSLICFILPYD